MISAVPEGAGLNLQLVDECIKTIEDKLPLIEAYVDKFPEDVFALEGLVSFQESLAIFKAAREKLLAD